MAQVGYFRTSTNDQSIDSQRTALGENLDREFIDAGVSGAVQAHLRPAFAELLNYVRQGDTVHVYAVDRLGRDALDVQSTVRMLLSNGVSVNVHGLGVIGSGTGELILAVLAQVADMERHRIRERCESGRATARASMAASGKTHRGKVSLGRPVAQDRKLVAAWRQENVASISATAKHFGISIPTVKRYCASLGSAV
jgi:putative DNA-invertase from lambdoid prophage Rac